MVHIFSPKGKEQNSDITKQTIWSLVKSLKLKIRINMVKHNHFGDIVVEMEREENLNTFTICAKLKSVGLSVSLATKGKPTLIVYDVPDQGRGCF